MSELNTTKLFEYHNSKGAKIINFAGWSMPFSYEGTLKEHQSVRTNAGFFDVSHMGRIELQYEQIKEISNLICSEIISLPNNKALYTIFTHENGNSIDDVIFWKFENRFVLICNASNTKKIEDHLNVNSIHFQNITGDTSLIAVQGPTAIDKLSESFTIPKNFHTYSKDDIYYARTGYTGEDGIEFMIPNNRVVEFINYLENLSIHPCGLGARDTLRLEASLPLYGFELTDLISPVEAGLKWTVTNSTNYKGKETLDQQISTGDRKYLKKFIYKGKQIPRTGTIAKSGDVNGLVTSGNISPVLEHPIGFVLFDSKPPTDLVEFDIRGNLVEGNLISKRFLS